MVKKWYKMITKFEENGSSGENATLLPLIAVLVKSDLKKFFSFLPHQELTLAVSTISGKDSTELTVFSILIFSNVLHLSSISFQSYNPTYLFPDDSKISNSSKSFKSLYKN